MTLWRIDRWLVAFLVLAAGVVAVSVAVSASAAFAAQPDLLSGAMTFDLVVLVPALYWLLVIRRGTAGWRTIAPVAVVCLVLAHVVVPSGHQGALGVARLALAPIELAIVCWVIWGAVGLLRTGGTRDTAAALRGAITARLGEGALARFLASELAVLVYALRVRSGRAGAAEGERFEVARLDAMAATLGALVVVETIALHLFVSRWSGAAAWALTGLSAYSLVWLVGLHRAIAARPVEVGPEDVAIRVGLSAEAVVPMHWILRVGPAGWRDTERREAGVVHASAPATPNVRFDFAAPASVDRLFGRRVGATAITLRVEDPEGLIRAVRARMAALSS